MIDPADPSIFAGRFSAPPRQRAVPVAIQVLGYLTAAALVLVWLASVAVGLAPSLIKGFF